VGEARERRQEAHDGAGEADVDGRGPAHEVRHDLHGDVSDVVVLDDVHLVAEQSQPGHHQLGVAGVEQAADRALALGEGRQHQRAVARRLRARHGHHRVDRPGGGRGRPQVGDRRLLGSGHRRKASAPAAARMTTSAPAPRSRYGGDEPVSAAAATGVVDGAAVEAADGAADDAADDAEELAGVGKPVDEVVPATV
jgi:hypothetical protein